MSLENLCKFDELIRASDHMESWTYHHCKQNLIVFHKDKKEFTNCSMFEVSTNVHIL